MNSFNKPINQSTSQPINGFTVVTVWDGRDYYPKEYINKLYRAVQRNTTIPHDFVLYIGPEAEKPGRCDGIDSAIRIVPTGMPYWWMVIKFWEANPVGIFTKDRLLLDLDLVIIRNIDDIINYPSEHCMSVEFPSGHFEPGSDQKTRIDNTLSTEYLPEQRPVMNKFYRYANTGVSLIRNNAGAKVWEAYERLGSPKWDPLDRTANRGVLPLAEQTIINDPQYGVEYDLFPEDWVCSYKYRIKGRDIPATCKIIHFHGQPKQVYCMHEPFVKECWT